MYSDSKPSLRASNRLDSKIKLTTELPAVIPEENISVIFCLSCNCTTFVGNVLSDSMRKNHLEMYSKACSFGVCEFERIKIKIYGLYVLIQLNINAIEN